MQPAAFSSDPSRDSAVTAPQFTPFVTSHANHEHELLLSVGGIHCARCIHAIESCLNEDAAVQEARVNMSTGRLVIHWQGDASLAEALAHKVSALGYDIRPLDAPSKAPLSEEAQLLRYVAVAGFGMGNIMLLSVALWSSNQQVMGLAMRDLFHWVSALIALPIIAYAGRPFFSSALAMLRHGRTNMDVPISLALVLASAMSIAETWRHGEHAYFDSAVMLLFFLLCGRWLDARARGKARQGAQQLLESMQGVATIEVTGGGVGNTQTIKMSELRAGMVLRIAAGDKIPADAKVTHGQSDIDTSLLNGESLPQSVHVGDTIYAGTINISAPLVAIVQKASADSMLAQVVRLMEQAEQGRARYVRLADKAAKLYTPVVHSLAAAAFLGWLLLGNAPWQDALLIAITTLIITCPCALGLAVPVVQVLASGWLMKHGLLLKSGDALEQLKAVDTIVCDKTGTLTSHLPTLKAPPADPAVFQLAASLAAHSQHPLSNAVAQAYDGELLTLHNVQEHPGHGMQAQYQGRSIQLGKRSWCGDTTAPESPLPELWLAQDGTPLCAMQFNTTLIEGAHEMLHSFAQQNMPIHLLSGDRESVVAHVAKQLNIAHYRAHALPADKIEYIEALKQKGHHVLMIGDGLNDAAALAAADVSLAPASGMDITQNAADIIIQNPNLRSITKAHFMAKFSTRLVQQNFALAVAYNCFAIPLAVAGYVTPLVAAIAMSSSSLIVITNSFRINLTSHMR